jgi:hypothetical protein
MIVDNALANLEILWNSRCGDTGRRGAEHRSFLRLRLTHPEKLETGYRHA